MAKAKAAAVANAFLDIQGADKSAYPQIDQMKLQKLVYYAHAWWLAYNDEELFEDDIEAWPWGPVVRDIYLQFKDFGRNPIKGRRAVELVHVGPNSTQFDRVEPTVVDAQVYEYLRSVWETHKRFTGVQLSNATHAMGEPWQIVLEKYGDLDSKPRIPNELIRDVFRKKITPADTAAAA